MDKVIEVNGIRVSYTRDCMSNSPLGILVFLHGWGGSSQSWRSNVQKLSRAFDCIAVDMPGFGVSDKPSKVWGVAEYAEFVRNFARALNLSTFVLIGKSFGGRVAMFYASKYPKELLRLILVAAAGIEKRSFLTRIKTLLAQIGKAVLSLFGSRTVENFRSLYYKMAKVTRDADDYKWEVKKVVTNTDLTGSAECITIPTLIIWGEDDSILPFKVGEELNRRIKGSKLRCIPGGHNAHQESAQDFNSLVIEYLTND